MTLLKNMDEWRAEKLGYVLFSRLENLIIDEENFQNPLFDFLIDIGKKNTRTGRLFGVEIKSKPQQINKTILTKYKNISFPALIVSFDNKTDRGSYQWIKKPGNNGELLFNTANFTAKPLSTEELKHLVSEIEDWYTKKSVSNLNYSAGF